jgi:hypothetical protein
VIIDAILAILKLFAGIVSGSVGLIADGTDAALDTVSAGVVLWSVKKKKEIIGTFVIIIMMFVTTIGLGFDSVSNIVENFTGEAEIISNPILVIVIESIALLFAVLLMFYQRFTGKRERNFALITQSVDSKNHIYVAIAVISGAVLSMFGIILVDSLIGVYIVVKIFIDAIALLKETLSSITRAKYENSIHTLLTSNTRILIFSRRSKTCIPVDYKKIKDTVEETGKLGSIKLTIMTEEKNYCFDYMSPRKSFGFLSEFHKHLNHNHSDLENSENEDFFMKISTLSKIQKYLVTQGIK